MDRYLKNVIETKNGTEINGCLSGKCKSNLYPIWDWEMGNFYFFFLKSWLALINSFHLRFRVKANIQP